MKAVFADTFYYLAMINPRDAAHQAATDYSKRQRLGMVTTMWVLTEVGDGLADTANRPIFPALLAQLDKSRRDTIVWSDEALFRRGVALYDARADKQWSLTDCISFVVMQEHGLREALTGDHHFEQAGFVALLK